MFKEVSRYPEWKALFDGILPLIEAGKTDFSYEILTELSGIDIRSDRGRAQFYRFRRALLEEKQLWLENISKHGYSIIPAADHSTAARRRVDGAKRRIKVASSITTNVKWDELQPEERVIHAATAALLHEIGSAMQVAARKFRMIANDRMDGIDTKKLIEAMKKK